MVVSNFYETKTQLLLQLNRLSTGKEIQVNYLSTGYQVTRNIK